MKKFQTTARQFFTRGRGSRDRVMFLVGSFALCSIIAATTFDVSGANGVGAAQGAITGEWIAELDREKADKVHMSFHRRTERGGINMSSTNLSLGELQGLTLGQASSAGAPVNFRLAREAGTFLCEGYFREGKGSGHWTLAPSESFVAAMRGRGYDDLREEQLLSAAMHDLTVKFVEELKAAGYERPPFNKLVGARIFNVTPEFIREMGSLGFGRLSLEELTSARIFRVDGEYARAVEAMGLGRPPFKKLIGMRVHKITPEFIREMRAAGFENLAVDDLIKLKIHRVTPEFISELKAAGYDRVSADDAVRLRIHGVTGDYIRRMKERGFTNLTLDQLVRLRIHGIAK